MNIATDPKSQLSPEANLLAQHAPATGILTVDLDAIIANWRKLEKTAVPAECAAVVKANAYGCGAERVSQALAKAGCKTFFVANVEEAAVVRAAVPSATVYSLGGFFPNTGDMKAGDNRVQEVSQITQGLKALAKELSVPVIALSQLSRQVENREDKRPQLSDLRESGSIEQDADVVMFVFRESYYLSRAEPREGTPEHLTWQEQMDQLKGLAEVIIGKQRHGPIGIVKLSFDADTTKFGNLAQGQRYESYGD